MNPDRIIALFLAIFGLVFLHQETIDTGMLILIIAFTWLRISCIGETKDDTVHTDTDVVEDEVKNEE